MGRRSARILIMVLALSASLWGEALAQTVKMVFQPESKAESQCNPHPEFGKFGVKKIAVLNFENSPQDKKEKFEPSKLGHNIQPMEIYVYLGEEDGAVFASMFEKALARTYKYSMIERRRIDKVMKEIAFSQTGFISNEDALSVGKMLSADAIIVGKVINAYSHLEVKLKGTSFLCTYIAHAAVEFRMIHLETGEIIWNCNIARNTLNYLDNKLSVKNTEVVANPHIFDQPLHGGTPEERLNFVLGRIAEEAAMEIAK